ncbi:MAG: heme-copper oxidase subunit III [Chloroflexi bacterium]|jgi:cytochrome c oxidase subunit 3|nr:heme-copper oxidase subunit III [Chloroflexota bacterium]MBJ7360138.1 heme-copper oxidase subunit III [Chloroflexota bacterium]MBJ7482333.1 heme-copper oxidase subunit III [Chloroflexota bacterium]
MSDSAVAPSVLAPAAGHAGGHAAGHGKKGLGNPVLGMLLFIVSEIMFFAGLFAAYFSLRTATGVWPPEGNPAFELHSEALFPGIMTALLVLSSVTCQFAVWRIRRGDRQGMNRALAMTVILGVIFLIGQVYDYTQLGFGISDGVFGSTFYVLTGFHGAHVLGGVLMLAVCLYRGGLGQFSAEHHDMVEATSIYWHFVDVVWVLLFALLYFI